MAFSSPLFLLGIGAPPVTDQGGFKTPLPTYNAGAVLSGTQGGFRTPLPTYNSGAISGPIQGGYKTVLPFWMAGGGVGEDPETQVRGGKSRRRERERRKILEALNTLGKRQEEINLLPEEISETVIDVLKEGKADIEGIEVKVEVLPTPPQPTIKSTAPTLDSIISDTDREIAELIRAQENLKFVDAILDYREDVYKFEEEFLVFLILIME